MRGNKMKTQLKVIALSVLVATSAYAEESKGVYFGLGVHQSKVSGEGYKKNNWKVLVGTRLNSNWSIEGQYADLATDEFSYTNTKETVKSVVSGNSFGVAGLYHFNPQGSYSPFVKLGWHHLKAKITRVTTPTTGAVVESNESESGNHEFYGVGVDGKINETIKYRVEYERMNVGEGSDVNNIGVSLLFGF